MDIKVDDLSKIGRKAFELIWKNTNDAIFLIGDDGAIVQANPTFTEILGWTIEDIRGLTPPPPLHGMTTEEHKEFLDRLRRGQNINYCFTERKTKDGEILDILSTYRAINKDGILALGMYKDFTEQMEIQKKLEENEDRYRKLVEYSPDAIIVQNKNHILYANPAGTRLLGQDSPNDMVGRSIWKFIYSENKKDIEQRLFNMMDDFDAYKPVTIVERFIRYDYKQFYAEVTALPIIYNGEVVMQILLRDVTVRKKYEKELENLAYYDSLTGLRNRRSFMEILEQGILSASKIKEQLALFYLDIDKFKEINDVLGHDAGDELLKQFSQRLVSNLREDSIIGRLGGDEFVVLIRGVKNGKSVYKIVERLYKALQQEYTIGGHRIEATASIGISLYPKNGTSSELLIKHADEALYLAKETRNQYHFHSLSHNNE
ncbi:diguanylate cyclase domain-containing protein [Neobacillus sp. YIM B06451]|uniref:diguanylate cyclase domain-containing protein n=1 Tax=Neobacillus sp. YIM B06451 TaxID=3070994 RepID=UPI00292E4301|nr:diguanylate cyclase [Neobacillus sp. YIM B06451]